MITLFSFLMVSVTFLMLTERERELRGKKK